MLIQPGRIFAATLDEAIFRIRERYGDGKLSIRPANVQPNKSYIWWEFYIELPYPPGRGVMPFLAHTATIRPVLPNTRNGGGKRITKKVAYTNKHKKTLAEQGKDKHG